MINYSVERAKNLTSYYNYSKEGGKQLTEKNTGGFLGGIGYTLAKAGTGIIGIGEGIWDFTAGGIAKLFGQDEWAEEQFENNFTGELNQSLDDWYNPSKGWQLAGDVAGGIGNSLVGIGAVAGVTFISGGTLTAPMVALIAGGTIGLGAAGMSTTSAYEKTGELGGKEFGYGALSGFSEGALEAVTGAAGKVAKSFLKPTVKTIAKKSVAKGILSAGLGEAFEEGMQEMIDPYLQRWTKVDPNAENATIQEIGYSALVGGLSGMFLGGAGEGISAISRTSRGNKIVEAGKADTVLGMAKDFAKYESEQHTGMAAFSSIESLVSQYEILKEANGDNVTLKQKKILADIERTNTALVFSPMIKDSLANIRTNSQAFVDKINSMQIIDPTTGKARTITVEQLMKDDSLAIPFAVADAVGKIMIDSDSYTNAALEGKKLGTREDFRKWQESATPKQKQLVSEKLGVDIDTVSEQDFERAIYEFDKSGRATEYKQVSSMIAQAKSELAKNNKLVNLPDAVAINDNSAKWHSFKGEKIAIVRRGDAYHLYLDGKISKSMSKAELKEQIAKIKGKEQGTNKTTQKKKPVAKKAVEVAKPVKPAEAAKPIESKKLKEPTKKQTPKVKFKAEAKDSTDRYAVKSKDNGEKIVRAHKVVVRNKKRPKVYTILEDANSGKFRIVKLNPQGELTIKDGFDTLEKAYEYHTKEISSKETRLVPKELIDTHRGGLDYRNNNTKNIGIDELVSTFNFKGVEFGDSLNKIERQVWLNYCYDALIDLSDALNISRNDISFNDTLSISFDLDGVENASADYNPSRNVINLTKKDGAGWVAHEWWHAFEDIIIKNDISTRYKAKDIIKKPDMTEDAYNELCCVIDGLPDYNNNSLAKDAMEKAKEPYWGDAEEMRARAFASYISDLTEKKNDYLSGHSESSVDMNKNGNIITGHPRGAERKAINKVFSKLFKAAKQEGIFKENTETKPTTISNYAASASTEISSEVQPIKLVNRIHAKLADGFARINVTGYSEFNEGRKLEVRWTIASGRMFGVDDATLRNLANISAKSSISIGFAKIDGDAVVHTKGGEVTVYLNPKSSRTIEAATLHELTHALKGVEGYAEIEKAAKADARANPEKVAKIKNRYLDFYNEKGLEFNDEILNDEITSHYIEEMLAGRKTLYKLTETSPSFIGQAIDWIKKRVKILNKVPEVNSELSRIERVFVSTFNRYQTQNVGSTAKFARYRIAKSFSEQIDDVLNNKHDENFDLYLSHTPKVLLDIGLPNKALLMKPTKIKKLLAKHSEMSVEMIKAIPQAIENPILILKPKTYPNDSVVVIADIHTAKGEMVIPVWINQEGTYIDVEYAKSIADKQNFVASAYGRNVKSLIEHSLKNDEVLFINKDKNKAKKLFSIHGLQLPSPLKATSFTNSISKKQENVNLNQKNSSDRYAVDTKNDKKYNKSIVADSIEYGILRKEVMRKNSKKQGSYPADYAFTANNFYIYDNFGDESFNSLYKIKIAGNEDFIASEIEKIGEQRNEPINRDTRHFKRRFNIYRNRKRGDSRNNANVQGQRGENGRNDRVSSEQSHSDTRGDIENGIGDKQQGNNNDRYALSDIIGSDKVLTKVPNENVSVRDVMSGNVPLTEYKTHIKDSSFEMKEGLQILLTNAQATVEQVLKDRGITDGNAKTNYIRAGKYAAFNSIDVGGAQYNLLGDIRVGNSLGTIWKDIYRRNKLGDKYKKNPVKFAKFEKYSDYYQKFMAYLLHWHNSDRMAESVLKPVFGADITAEISFNEINKLDLAYPKFMGTAEKMWKFLDNSLEMRLESGLISQEHADNLRKMYPHYVPTFRDTDGGGISSIIGRSNVKVKKTIKTAKGSDMNILPIDEIVAQQTMQLVSTARLNSLLNQVYISSKAKKNYDEFVIKQELAAGKGLDIDLLINTDRLKNEITFYSGSNQITATVSRNFFRVIEAFEPSGDSASNNVVLNAVTKLNTTFKKLVTSWNPFFSFFRNPLRDIQEAGLYTKYSLRVFAKNYGRARKEIANNGRYWQEAKAAGILRAGVYSYEKGLSLKKENNFSKMLNKIEQASNALEMAPRMAEYISARESGKNVEQALLESADITVNFGRSGTFTKKLNSTVMPFLNPSIQGMSKMVRAFTGKDAAKSFTNLIIRSVMLGIALIALNDLLNEDNEDYNKLSNFVKENNYVIALSKSNFVKIPKGRVLSVIDSLYLRTKWMTEGDDKAREGYLSNFMTQVTPVDNFTRTIFSPFTDISTNTTWYGGDIESQKYNNVAPAQRYDESTSTIAIWLGKVFDYSPAKIDYLLNQYGGVVADVALPLTTEQAEGGIISQNFFTNGVTNSKWASKFYDTIEEYTHSKSAGDNTAKGVIKYLNSIKGTVRDLYSQRRTIQADTTLSDSEKLKQTKILQATINALQKDAIENAKYLEIELAKYDLSDDVFDDSYRDAVSTIIGEEFALRTYNSAVYAKAKQLTLAGIGYGVYYDYYFDTRELDSDVDNKGNTISNSKKEKIMNYTQSLTIPIEQKYILLMSSGYKINNEAKRGVAMYISRLKLTKQERTDLAKICGLTINNDKIIIK